MPIKIVEWVSHPPAKEIPKRRIAAVGYTLSPFPELRPEDAVLVVAEQVPSQQSPAVRLGARCGDDLVQPMIGVAVVFVRHDKNH